MKLERVSCGQVRFSWLFFAGAVPVFLSFFIATLLCHYNNWDPVLVALRRVYVFISRKHRIHRYVTCHPADGGLADPFPCRRSSQIFFFLLVPKF